MSKSKEEKVSEYYANALRRALNSGIYNVSRLGQKANIIQQRISNLKHGHTPRKKEYNELAKYINGYNLPIEQSAKSCLKCLNLGAKQLGDTQAYMCDLGLKLNADKCNNYQPN